MVGSGTGRKAGPGHIATIPDRHTCHWLTESMCTHAFCCHTGTAGWQFCQGSSLLGQGMTWHRSFGHSFSNTSSATITLSDGEDRTRSWLTGWDSTLHVPGLFLSWMKKHYCSQKYNKPFKVVKSMKYWSRWNIHPFQCKALMHNPNTNHSKYFDISRRDFGVVHLWTHSRCISWPEMTPNIFYVT